MAWLAVDIIGSEWIFREYPKRILDYSWQDKFCTEILLPDGSIKKLIGKEITWSDEPVELKESN